MELFVDFLELIQTIECVLLLLVFCNSDFELVVQSIKRAIVVPFSAHLNETWAANDGPTLGPFELEKRERFLFATRLQMLRGSDASLAKEPISGSPPKAPLIAAIIPTRSFRPEAQLSFIIIA